MGRTTAARATARERERARVVARTAGETFLSATAARTARRFSSWPSMRSTESNSPEPRSRWLRMPDAAKAARGRAAAPASAKAADEPRTRAARRDASATPWESGAMRAEPSNANTLAQLRRRLTARISLEASSLGTCEPSNLL